MKNRLEFYGSAESSQFADLARIGDREVPALIADTVRYFLDDMRDDREVVFRADVRVEPADPTFRAGMFDGPEVPQETVQLRGELVLSIYDEGYVISSRPVVERVLDAIRTACARFIDTYAAISVDVIIQAEESDGMHDLPNPFELEEAASYGG